MTSTLGRSAKMKKSEKTECWGRRGKNANTFLQAAAGINVITARHTDPEHRCTKAQEYSGQTLFVEVTTEADKYPRGTDWGN